MVIGTTTVPDYTNVAFFPPAWSHGTISQGIFVWRVYGGTPTQYYDNGLVYASGNYGSSCPEGIPSEIDDGVPFPGNCDVRVLSPWSDSRAPTPNTPPSSGIFVPNTKNGTNVGMEVISENSAAGFFTIKMYQTNPQDASPAKSRNLQVSSVKVCSPLPCRYRPKLTWDVNTEPDMSGGSAKYYIYRKVTYAESGEIYCNWTFLTSVSYNQYSWIDAEAETGYLLEDGFIVFYKIKAKDNRGLFSTYSLDVSIGASCQCSDPITITRPSDEIDLMSNNDYSLHQNYPNTFNPITTIRYQVLIDGYVILRVYNMLSQEVAVLVNEVQEAGEKAVSFDARNLPSGM
jgi:hypothetical protein